VALPRGRAIPPRRQGGQLRVGTLPAPRRRRGAAPRGPGHGRVIHGIDLSPRIDWAAVRDSDRWTCFTREGVRSMIPPSAATWLGERLSRDLERRIGSRIAPATQPRFWKALGTLLARALTPSDASWLDQVQDGLDRLDGLTPDEASTILEMIRQAVSDMRWE